MNLRDLKRSESSSKNLREPERMTECESYGENLREPGRVCKDLKANYLCFGLQPVWFHATNILLHAAACILFTRVCLSIAGLKPPFATLAGLLFAAHPIHTEAVTGIVGRADVLACVFFLVSLLAYHG
ncbi:hypothetical protein Zmor_000112 [Zophobas morio]|uniref:Uncharacterized protein n=1 Tax=Zophobas morio TaxID=2755281 RepID=A0AA38MR60_9CUCU|nr:hypothetical protein Zmor_000112 [Zophobas morio]